MKEIEMPNYTFKCDNCNTRFEKSLKIEQAEKGIACINCGTITTNKLPPSGVGFKMAESKKIPKDIDLAVGKDAAKKWEEYEEKKRLKDKIRKESGSERLSVDFDGNYQPFSMQADGKEVSGQEGTKYRKEMLETYLKVKKDPKTEASIPTVKDFDNSVKNLDKK
jgi:putative FmdB family regulatory protein